MKKINFIVFPILVFVLLLSGCSSTQFIKKSSKSVNNYDLSINVDCDKKAFTCLQNVSYINNSDDVLTAVVFNLYPTAFSAGAVNKPVSALNEGKAYPNGKSYGTFEILSVKILNADANYEFDGVDKSFLVVYLGQELYKNQRVEIEIEFMATLPNIAHRYGYGDNTINFGNFYPIACVYDGAFIKNAYHSNGDPFYSDWANYNVKITYDEGYVLANSGNKINSTENEGKITTNIKAHALRDFAFVLSDKFSYISEVVGNTKVEYYYYNDENAQKSLKVAVDSLKTFNNLFGEYPYASISVAKTNFVHGGMEYPNLIFISDNLGLYADYVNTIVHEMAHQWWYGLVGNNEYDNGWLDEGLTEYSTAIFYRENADYGVQFDEIIKNANNSYSLFVQVYEDVFGEVETSMNRKLNEYNTEPEYVYMAYVKGMLFFNNLEKVVGEKKFLKAIKTYFDLYKGKNATPENLLYVFEKTTFCKMESLFDSWINGKDIVAKL